MSKAATTELPVDRLGSWLERAIPGFHDLQAAHKFPGGQSNPTFLLEAGSGRYVLRRKPPGRCWPRRTPWIANTACCARWNPPLCRCRGRSRCATTTP